MGTEDEAELTMQGRATAAAGAALVAACIVNPLDVIKTRIQAQAMAESAGQRGCSTPWTCSSTLYEHVTPHSLHHTHGLSDCQHHQHAGNPAAARPWLPQRHAHTLSPEAAAWWFSSHGSTGTFPSLSSSSSSSHIGRLAIGTGSSSGQSATAAAAAAALSAARSAAADKAAAAAAAFRRWGITEGPLPIRRTPPFPVPAGWVPPPVAPTAAAAAAGAASVALPGSSALATAAGASCPQCLPQQSTFQTNSMWEMAKAISKAEGLPVLWRGTSASLLIAVPMVGIYMPLYDHLLDSWSSRLGSVAPVVAGTAARTAACFCVAPFELIRTRLQASAAAGVSMRSTLSSLVSEHHAALPSSSAAAAKAAASQQLPAAAPAGGATRAAAAASTAAPRAATAAAAAAAASTMQPQAQIRPAAVLMAVPRMWTGFSATLVRDVPFSALYWALVEPLRQAMLPVNSHWPPLERLQGIIHKQQRQQQGSSSGGATSSSSSVGGNGGGGGSGSSSGSGLHGRLAAVPPSQQHLMHHSQLEILVANMISGFIAGGFAAGITTPFDVVKTRMQIASPSQQQLQQALGGAGGRSSSRGSRGLRVFYILRDVYHKEGLEGLFSGVKPRAARAAPACAIVISVYELLKSYLTPAS